MHTQLFHERNGRTGDLLPTSTVLHAKMRTRYFTPHDYFEPTYSCTSDVRLPSQVGDGPKWLCGVDALPSPCRVLSLGSDFDDAFERAMYARVGCQSHIVVDLTLGVASMGRKRLLHGYKRSKESVVAFTKLLASYGATLNHTVGVGDPRGARQSFRVVGFEQLLRDRYGDPPWHVHVLKMDIEGHEQTVLLEAYALCAAGKLEIDQLNVEVHTFQSAANRTVGDLYAIFDGAKQCGLMLHHKERNLWGCRDGQCLEYAWVSMRHARREMMATLGL